MNENLSLLKYRYPELNYSIYCKLKQKGLRNVDISEMYEINIRALTFFVKNHYKILGNMESV